MKKLFYILLILSFYNCKNSLDLGSGYFVHSTQMGCRAIGKDFSWNVKSNPVFGHVTEYAVDDKFIIAKRVNQDSLMARLNLAKRSWKKLDQLAQNFTAEYYIINKQVDSTFGPLTKSQYSILKKKLKINKSLEI
ncbi:DUF3997 domain-containing protein [Flavobacterium selenitireducens]|uniref:DUF3997 domain-containing protein n=1 Tax=Flavobacterium selenitireducens TaxID=2722704 RepID=UPI00168AD0A7|nr:DUF3997 domain-containing protein [Flavobacterium selenitireducens]MBD3581568.1 DUF3997 domain-containing protein [Flavobacterium selenitireducens]